MSANYITFPQIDPIIFSVGPISLRWYGLMYLVAFGLAWWLANRAASKKDSGWTEQQVSDLLFVGFMGVILGGRIGYVLFYQFDMFLEDPLYLFKIWTGGMSFHGGLLGVLTAMAWFAWRNNKGYLQLGDFVAPLIPLGLAAGRLGNFINAELWGRTTDVPWGVVFPGAGPAPRHRKQRCADRASGSRHCLPSAPVQPNSPPSNTDSSKVPQPVQHPGASFRYSG